MSSRFDLWAWAALCTSMMGCSVSPKAEPTVPGVAPTASGASEKAPLRWSEARATEWFATRGWLVGVNYIPSTAINQLEMWQADTFDPITIDRELGWAESLGFNSIRVFLHDLAWKQDPLGFYDRVDRFLAIAEKHHIGVM